MHNIHSERRKKVLTSLSTEAYLFNVEDCHSVFNESFVSLVLSLNIFSVWWNKICTAGVLFCEYMDIGHNQSPSPGKAGHVQSREWGGHDAVST